jgi:hypothetical protein
MEPFVDWRVTEAENHGPKTQNEGEIEMEKKEKGGLIQ